MTKTSSSVLITGGSGGIGSACCVAFARCGQHVFINYHNQKNRAEKIAAEIKASGGSATTIKGNVAIAAEVQAIFDEVKAESGGLSCIVNCAGAIIRPSSVHEISDKDWIETLNVNLGGVLNCSRYGAPSLRDNTAPSIVNVGSVFGSRIGAPAVGVYAAAKAGVISLTKSFARSLGPHIRVNCVVPGIIDTEMTRSSPDRVMQDYVERTILKRIGHADEVAAAVIFLAGATYITGQSLVVDGGYTIS